MHAKPRVLPGTEAARRPFWSPDSRSIGFFANSELKRIEARGGGARAVTYALGGTTAAWGTDGSILFSGTDAPELRRVNAAGGTAVARHRSGGAIDRPSPSAIPAWRPAVSVLRGRARRCARRLPGFARFLRGVPSHGVGYTRCVRYTRLVVVCAPGHAAGTALRSCTTDTQWRTDHSCGLGRSRAHHRLRCVRNIGRGSDGFRAARPSMTRLSWSDRAGNALGAFGSPEQDGLSNIRFSPDGRRVAVERTLQNETDVWLLDSMRQTRFTRGSDGSIARLPVWSPNGNRIAFESVGSGSVKLAVKPSSGGGQQETLFESPQGKIPCDWSPDGRFLLYYIPDPKSGTDLWVLPEKRASRSSSSRPTRMSSGASSHRTDAG